MSEDKPFSIAPVGFEREKIPVLPRKVLPAIIHDDSLVDRLNQLRERYRFFKFENEPTIYFLGWNEVSEIYRNWPVFSSRYNLKETEGYKASGEVALIPAGYDPPEAKLYKEFLTQKFSEQEALALEPAARARARELTEALLPTGEVEYMAGFAGKYFGPIILRHAGIPDEHIDQVQQLEHDTFLTKEHDPDGKRHQHATRELPRLLKEIVAKARTDFAANGARSNSVLDYLLATSMRGGDHMSDAEICATLQILCLGGAHSVKAALGYAMKVLADNPHLRKAMYEDGAVSQKAVDELLRWNGVGFGHSFRTVADDSELSGCPLRKGDSVCTVMTAANHDPAALDDADELVFDRTHVKSLTFAVGIHRCLGINFAKMGVRVGIEEWHRRIPDYEIATREGLPEQTWAGVGYLRLPLKWQPS
jgi:cytochrome P450